MPRSGLRAGERYLSWPTLSSQCFFGTPRGLGLATVTTSAAFFPHLEQRIRSRCATRSASG